MSPLVLDINTLSRESLGASLWDVPCTVLPSVASSLTRLWSACNLLCEHRFYSAVIGFFCSNVVSRSKSLSLVHWHSTTGITSSQTGMSKLSKSNQRGHLRPNPVVEETVFAVWKERNIWVLGDSVYPFSKIAWCFRVYCVYSVPQNFVWRQLGYSELR